MTMFLKLIMFSCSFLYGSIDLGTGHIVLDGLFLTFDFIALNPQCAKSVTRAQQ